MSEENKQLIDLGDLGIQTADELAGELEVLTKTSDFLPQVRIYGSENNLVKRQKFPLGHFGLYHSSDKVEDLGEEFNCLCVAARPRACIIDDTPVSYYDHASKEFDDVKTKAFAKVDGYLVGLEYLVWVPSFAKFALFFMGSITLRRESANMQALVGKAGTLKIKLIEGKKYTWHGCECYHCSAPIALPDTNDLKAEVVKFQNPASSDKELVKEDESGRSR